jgi:succinate dehydrogenase hydrophobic anchor subunit
VTVNQQPPSLRLSDVPKAFWAGLVLAAVGFVVNVSETSRSSSPDGTTCSYTNYAAFAFAVVIVICIVTGWQDRGRRAPAYRLAAPITAAFTIALLGLAFVHVFRGTGTIGGACN